ncbi:MAG: DUF2254 domain-containing protein [Anaerolineae bacterium]|nr:DUF2254 domain-containing protein [Anaerolineae bacterium]
MKTKLLNFWENLRSTYWFLPSLLAVLAIVLAMVTIQLDEYLLLQQANSLPWLYTGGPEGARSLLSTVAGSMITVAGVTFSITIVALTLASSQFGPRLLNNFIRDRGNQIVLGTFIATFVYCLLILRTVRSEAGNSFVPPISISISFLLALASLGVLIYFIHHISSSMNVENVIAAIERDLDQAIERLFPKHKSFQFFEQELREEDDIPQDFEQSAQPVTASKNGYVQAIDHEGLLELAKTQDLLLRLEYRPGNFVTEGNALALAWPGDRLNGDPMESINDAFIVGAQRLQMQDVEFAINQLVEIAVRALSPGVNDPFTAMACLDRLGAALSNLAERTIPSAYHYDNDNNLRLIGQSVTFAGIVDTAFNQIRQYGRSSVAVSTRLLETITVIAAHTHTPAERTALRRQASMTRLGAMESVPEAMDRQDIEAQYQLALKVLEQTQEV